MSDELAFNSKIDLWLLILLLGVVSLCGWLMADNWPGIAAGNWLLALPLALGIALPLWVLLSLRYFLSEHTLRIRIGPFNARIPIGEITAIEPTHNPLSSPALSLDRLRIRYASGRSVMISPEPREEFLRQLEYRRKQAA